MLAFGPPAVPAPIAPPTVVAPAPQSVSFGLVAGRVSPGTRRIVVAVDGRRVAATRVAGRRFRTRVRIPSRDVTVRVTAVGAAGARRSRAVGPVFGLPPAAAPTAARPHEDAVLARKVRALALRFPGVAAVYVEDLRTGAGAAWNAGARYPAASTVKLAIAVAVMRRLGGPPPPGSELAHLLFAMLARSDNAAANELEVWLGGSESGGAALVNATLAELGLRSTEMYGGFIIGTASTRPIPIEVRSAPAFGLGKFTTAWDLARLARYLHLAAGGRGPLVVRVDGFTPNEARYLLFLLAHSTDHGKLDRYLGAIGAVILHKAGWIVHARHDNGLVYWRRGAFVATVMTWNASGVGASADLLAGRVASVALSRFRALAARPRAPRRVARRFAL